MLNSVDTIEKCLTSVYIGNAGSSYEIIIFDGCSTDGTIDIIKNHLGYINHFAVSPDGGPQFAINRALKIAKGSIVVILCADDYLEDDILNKIHSKFKAEPDMDILSCGISIYDQDGKLLKNYINKQELQYSIKNILKTPLSHGRFIKREIYDLLGGFPEKYKLCNDLFFLLSTIFHINIKSSYLELNSYNYLQHPNSSTMGDNDYKKLETYIDNYLIASYFIEKYRDKIEIYDLFLFYSLLYKSFVKSLLKTIELGGSISTIKFNTRIILSGIFFIPFILLKYILEKSKI